MVKWSILIIASVSLESFAATQMVLPFSLFRCMGDLLVWLADSQAILYSLHFCSLNIYCMWKMKMSSSWLLPQFSFIHWYCPFKSEAVSKTDAQKTGAFYLYYKLKHVGTVMIFRVSDSCWTSCLQWLLYCCFSDVSLDETLKKREYKCDSISLANNFFVLKHQC